MDLSMTTVPEKVSMRSTEYRKVIKPLLERRRRARINSCLDELKALILETTENENADTSKLEKADILELTVQHLRNFRHRQQQGTITEDKFRAGFAECASQVTSFFTGEDHQTKSRLMSHLAECINRIPHVVVRQTPEIVTPTTPPPSPISPRLHRLSPAEGYDYHHHHQQQQQPPCSNFSPTHQHPSDYLTCPSSPESVGHYQIDNRFTNEEFSDVYYSSVPHGAVYVRKIKSEYKCSKPWRPW